MPFAAMLMVNEALPQLSLALTGDAFYFGSERL